MKDVIDNVVLAMQENGMVIAGRSLIIDSVFIRDGLELNITSN